MESVKRNGRIDPAGIACLAAGAAFFAFIGWKWDIPFAVWIALPCLIRFARSRARWVTVLAVWPVLVAASFIKFSGTWGTVIGWEVELLVSVLLPLPVAAALCLDRLCTGRVPPTLQGLVFPSAYIFLDYCMGLTPGIGTGGSISIPQLGNTALLAAVAGAGLWGASFLIGWTASLAASWSMPAGTRGQPRSLLVSGACLAALMTAGGISAVAFPPDSPTVKAAGIAVDFSIDRFAEEIIEPGVPKERADSYKRDFARLEESLFSRSETAARGGAKIVFWSEANLFVYGDQLEEFTGRARRFAREHAVYFAPSIQVLRYGSTVNDNRSVMIAPDGDVVYSYRKAKSYKKTGADGVIRHVDSPFGRIGSVICFDLDFPDYMRQAGRNGIDILLVPAYDTRGGAPYHTLVGLWRAVDYGFSVFRAVNHGTSMAVDRHGRVLARQDFFQSPDGITYADLPSHGSRTLYASLGDWLPWAGLLYLAGLGLWIFVRRKRKAE